LATPDLCAKRWIWQQYDHMVMADTVQRPGGDAAVVRIHGTRRGLAMTTDCTPRYVAADPVAGGRQAVAEAWRNLTAVGARPLAVTDCLNFGSPERPEVMGQFVGAVRGLGEACEALDFPVVSGNVSFYNETTGQAIQPTPQIGGIGLIDDLAHMTGMGFAGEGQIIVLIGGTKGHLGASLFARDIVGSPKGAPPPVDLVAERRNGDFVRGLITEGRVTACHDVSDGGLLIAIAEMVLSGSIGANLRRPTQEVAAQAFWFGEDQARYVLTAKADALEPILEAARGKGVPAVALGETEGAALTVDGQSPISIARLRAAHEDWLPSYMAPR